MIYTISRKDTRNYLVLRTRLDRALCYYSKKFSFFHLKTSEGTNAISELTKMAVREKKKGFRPRLTQGILFSCGSRHRS